MKGLIEVNFGYGYLVYLKHTGKKWPVSFYGYDGRNYTLLAGIEPIEAYLKENNKIFYQNLHKEDDGLKPLLKSQILTIIGAVPVFEQGFSLADVYTLNEAARIWGFSDGSTIRHAIKKGKFLKHEAKQSDKTWLVTFFGMLRVFGPYEEEGYDKLIVNKLYFDETKNKVQTIAML